MSTQPCVSTTSATLTTQSQDECVIKDFLDLTEVKHEDNVFNSTTDNHIQHSVAFKQEKLEIKDELLPDAIGSSQFVCKSNTFTGDEDLKPKLEQHHPDIPHVTSTKSFAPIINAYAHNWEKPFACDSCNYRTNTKIFLLKHMESHPASEKLGYYICDKSTEKKSDTNMPNETEDEVFACNFCDYQTKRHDHLQMHVHIHTGQKPFACNLCDYRARLNSTLLKHMFTHTGEKPIACSLCDYRTNSSNCLRQHMLVHTSEKEFSCSLCDYKAKRKRSVKRHMRTHKEKKTFVCSLCDYKAAREYYFQKHMLTHANK